MTAIKGSPPPRPQPGLSTRTEPLRGAPAPVTRAPLPPPNSVPGPNLVLGEVEGLLTVATRRGAGALDPKRLQQLVATLGQGTGREQLQSRAATTARVLLRATQPPLDEPAAALSAKADQLIGAYRDALPGDASRTALAKLDQFVEATKLESQSADTLATAVAVDRETCLPSAELFTPAPAEGSPQHFLMMTSYEQSLAANRNAKSIHGTLDRAGDALRGGLEAMVKGQSAFVTATHQVTQLEAAHGHLLEAKDALGVAQQLATEQKETADVRAHIMARLPGDVGLAEPRTAKEVDDQFAERSSRQFLNDANGNVAVSRTALEAALSKLSESVSALGEQKPSAPVPSLATTPKLSAVEERLSMLEGQLSLNLRDARDRVSLSLAGAKASLHP